jgi:hypothetical protein
MARLPKPIKTFKSLLLVIQVLLFSCESKSPPPIPDPNQDGLLKNSKNLTGDDKDKNSEDATGPDLTPVKPSIGGADIGDEGSKSAVKICNTEGYYYDRYNGEKGACTKIQLAKVKCTQKGLQKILTESQIEQLETSLKKSYKGWLIDQCIDCPPDSTEDLCASKDGDEQVGTKVLFVKEGETANEIRGKAMFLPSRPTSKTSSKKKKDTSSDDET